METEEKLLKKIEKKNQAVKKSHKVAEITINYIKIQAEKREKYDRQF